VVAHQRRQNQNGLKLTTFLTRIWAWMVAAELGDVLQAAGGEQLQQLAVPLVVLGRVDVVVGGVDERGEEAVRQAGDDDGDGARPVWARASRAARARTAVSARSA
jgi:hypothetical protein